MLGLMKQPIRTERRTQHSDGQRRDAVVLPFSRPNSIALQASWYAKYPCTRMHGAAFEADFYPTEDTF